MADKKTSQLTAWTPLWTDIVSYVDLVAWETKKATVSDFLWVGWYVDWPASSTDNAIVRFDWTTWKLIQDSSILVDDSNNVSWIWNINWASWNMTITWWTASWNDLLLTSTSDATKGNIDFWSVTGNTWMRFDEVNDRLTIWWDETNTTIWWTSVWSKITTHTEWWTDLADLSIHRHSDTVWFGWHLIQARSRWTESSETVVQSWDVLWRIDALWHDGTDYEIASQIDFEVDGTPWDWDMPWRIVFRTSPDGSATPAEALRISQDKTTKFSWQLDINGNTIKNTWTLTLPTSTDTLIGRNTTDTLTNKSVDLSNNTLTGTTAQFNAALSDGDFATWWWTASGTNTWDQTSIVGITSTTAQFNASLSDNDFATIAWSEALTNKSVNGVTLTTWWVSTNFLDGTGNYSVPAWWGWGWIETVKIAGIIEKNTEFFEYIADGAKTVWKITVALQVRPAWQSFIVTTYKNWTQTDTFTITTSATVSNWRYKVTTDIAESLADWDVFTAKVTQVWTTTKWAELSFVANIS